LGGRLHTQYTCIIFPWFVLNEWLKNDAASVQPLRPPYIMLIFLLGTSIYRVALLEFATKIYGINSLINMAYFMVYLNIWTRTKICINDFLLCHELFINKVGSSWELQQGPTLEKVAFLQGSSLNSSFLVKILEPF